MLEAALADRPFAAGDAFSLADCSAFPALYYGRMQVPFASSNVLLAAYLAALEARPSIARVLREAEPYMHNVPR